MSDRLRRTVPALALRQDEAADALGMSVDHFERYVKPEIACVYSGRLRLYPIGELQKWLDRNTIKGGRRVRRDAA